LPSDNAKGFGESCCDWTNFVGHFLVGEGVDKLKW
jgi:hypothetical protein